MNTNRFYYRDEKGRFAKMPKLEKGILSPLWLLAIAKSVLKMRNADLTDPDNNEMIY